MDRRKPTLTLLTDFGPKDSFIGVMKGVITSIFPDCVIIDLCHEVSPQDVVEAGFILASSYSFFPKDTIHVVVVDPGVGSERAILAVKAKGYYFLVPDNGVIVPAISSPGEADHIVKVENREYFLEPVSRTFHGRDIFASVAAHLAKGVALSEFGPSVSGFERGPFPVATKKTLPGGKAGLQGEVIHVDNFGNLVTNVRLPGLKGVQRVSCGKGSTAAVGGTFADVGAGEMLAFTGSSGFLEIGINQGNAKEYLQAGRGEKVYVEVE